MNLEKVFKNLILLTVLLLILIVISTIYSSAQISNFNDNAGYGIYDYLGEFGFILSFLIIITLIILWLVSLFLLYRFKPFGKKLFIYTFVITLIVGFFDGDFASSAITTNLSFLAANIEGAIIVFLYFSPIKKKFEK
tara:strand:+ start:145 stop:555 length:411 start_codon:yes stop_codon:yes gene_type:complete